MLISGGEDHKVGQANDPDQRYARIEQYTRERFPMAGRLEFHWSGQIMEPIDCVSYTGRNPLDADNVFVHTGDSGMGMTHGTMAGILLTDLILGRENPWAKLYDPSRVNPKALHTYAKDNLTVTALYKDYATPGQVSDVAQIAPRTGAVMRRGMTKIAVYRDQAAAACVITLTPGWSAARHAILARLTQMPGSRGKMRGCGTQGP